MTLSDQLRRKLIAPQGLKGDDKAFQTDISYVPAAVLIGITERPEPGVLLTVRTANLRSHAGQVAFPGGRIDPGDPSPADAALREAWEEIGLPRDAVEVIAALDEYRTGTGFIITPVIGVIPPDLPLQAHAAEVDTIFETPLAHLMNSSNHIPRQVEHDGRMRSYYEILWDSYRIWGVTAAIIVNLAQRMNGGL